MFLYQSSLKRINFVNLKETHAFLLVILKVKNPFTVPEACTRWKTKRGIIFFRADNYAVAKEISVNKYCTKVKLRASTGETQSSHCQRITPLPRRMTQNVSDAM